MFISHFSFHFLNNARNIQNIKNNKPSGGNKHAKNTNIINIKQPISFHLLSHLIFDKLILTYYNLLVNKKIKKKKRKIFLFSNIPANGMQKTYKLIISYLFLFCKIIFNKFMNYVMTIRNHITDYILMPFHIFKRHITTYITMYKFVY